MSETLIVIALMLLLILINQTLNDAFNKLIWLNRSGEMINEDYQKIYKE